MPALEKLETLLVANNGGDGYFVGDSVSIQANNGKHGYFVGDSVSIQANIGGNGYFVGDSVSICAKQRPGILFLFFPLLISWANQQHGVHQSYSRLQISWADLVFFARMEFVRRPKMSVEYSRIPKLVDLEKRIAKHPRIAAYLIKRDEK